MRRFLSRFQKDQPLWFTRSPMYILRISKEGRSSSNRIGQSMDWKWVSHEVALIIWCHEMAQGEVEMRWFSTVRGDGKVSRRQKLLPSLRVRVLSWELQTKTSQYKYLKHEGKAHFTKQPRGMDRPWPCAASCTPHTSLRTPSFVRFLLVPKMWAYWPKYSSMPSHRVHGAC